MTTVTRDQARIEFLDLVIPQLWAGGFDRLAAEYSVERDRLVRRGGPAAQPRCVACGVRVSAGATAVNAAEALCSVTPDSVHTLNPESVEIGATTSTLGRVDQPGRRWLFFATAEARETYVAQYGHRYDYLLDWSDVSGFALEAVCTLVKGGQGYGVPHRDTLLDSKGRRLIDVEDGLYDDCDIACTVSHDPSCPQYDA
jgi:hypothetical protein